MVFSVILYNIPRNTYAFIYFISIREEGAFCMGRIQFLAFPASYQTIPEGKIYQTIPEGNIYQTITYQKNKHLKTQSS
jgi:hypothetical protein